jgi:predicted ribosomally synthesized peptide with nif11-like leader
MSREKMEAVRRESKKDPEFAAALSAAASTQEWVRIANERGFELEVSDLPAEEGADRELSDAELEGAAGGYTFPPTDWIYCDNPWTNWYCTLKC